MMYCTTNFVFFICIGGVNSLISGNPFANINVNSIADDYVNIFSTIVTRARVSIYCVRSNFCRTKFSRMAENVAFSKIKSLEY